jgi:hypothetical protein
MTNTRIRLSHAAGEAAPNTFTDFQWVRHNEKQLLEQYGECVILVFEENVIGTGQTIDEAMADAEQHLSVDMDEVTPILEFLHPRQPFFRVRAKQSER